MALNRSWNVRRLLGSLMLMFTFEMYASAHHEHCFYRITLEPDRMDYVISPHYPYYYSGPESCSWHVVSNERIRIECGLFDVPYSKNCVFDSFNIYTNSSANSYIYCGKGKFSKESDGNEMFITLKAPRHSPGGKFSCQLYAIKDQENKEDCRCGWKNPTKIVEGAETGINEYPMMAGLMNIGNGIIYCGGTIISRKHILTVAHCIMNQNLEAIRVILGEHNFEEELETNATRLYGVSRFYIHPLYNTIDDYDIAIVVIIGTITYTNEIGPACLPFNHPFDSFDGTTVYVLGWGATSYGLAGSNTLQETNVNVINNMICQKYFPKISERQICTHAAKMDACQGDSGGPVLWQNSTSRRLVLIGIISHGIGCAGEIPAVNTRVGAFINWIVRTTGAHFCEAE